MRDTERVLTTLNFMNTHFVLSSKNHAALQSFRVDHKHPVPELHVCLSGTGLLVTPREKKSLRLGSCVLIGPNTPHYFDIDPSASMFRLETLLHFRPDSLPRGYAWMWQENTVNTWELDDLYLPFAQLITNEIYSRGFDFENVVNSCYAVLFTHLARTSGNTLRTPLSGNASEEKIAAERYMRDKIDNFLFLNFGSDITIEDLASHLFVSTRQAHRLVKHYTGQTFKQYLIYIRMMNAKHLLKSTDLPVYRVAEKVGYAFSSNFCNAFHQLNLMTPETYRKWSRQETAEPGGGGNGKDT